MQNKSTGGEAKNSLENSRCTSLSQSETYRITLPSLSAPIRPTGIWKHDISPLGCLQSDTVERVSLRHHQSGRMFTFRANKNLTWRGRQRSRVLQANWDRESLLFQHWCHVYLARPLSHPVYPGRKNPLTNSLSASALFPTLLLQFVPWHTGLKRLTAFHSLGKTINPYGPSSSQSNPQSPQKRRPNPVASHRHTTYEPLILVHCILSMLLRCGDK